MNFEKQKQDLKEKLAKLEKVETTQKALDDVCAENGFTDLSGFNAYLAELKGEKPEKAAKEGARTTVTKEMKSTMKTMLTKGATIKETAATVGVSPATVNKYKGEFGLTRPKAK